MRASPSRRTAITSPVSCCSSQRDLLAYGFTNKEVSELTGLGKNTVKEIDLQRLKDKYTVDGKTLIKPAKQARFSRRGRV